MSPEVKREGLIKHIDEQFKSIFTPEFCHVYDYYGIGSKSVKNVTEALSEIPEIFYMRIITPFSEEDICQKRDLAIYITDPFDNNFFTEIGIQVKSSDHFILKFLQDINKDQNKAWSELARQKLILINGQHSGDKIKQDFNDQLKGIK